MNKPPKVNIAEIELSENDYVLGNRRWNCLKLIEHSKKYKPFKIPLASIDIGVKRWGLESMEDFMYHYKRVQNTSLDYPILLDDTGCICDGWHRVCKAILEGDIYIDAIRLETMPEHDINEV